MDERLFAIIAAPLGPAVALMAGAALGVVFYAGLWWTVRRAATFRHPALGVLTSLVLRMGLALGGFYLVSDGDWFRLLLCLAGFVLSRVAVTWCTRPPSSANDLRHAAIGTGHAP
jgi:F1F0 ATPase subunit 2